MLLAAWGDTGMKPSGHSRLRKKATCGVGSLAPIRMGTRLRRTCEVRLASASLAALQLDLFAQPGEILSQLLETI